MIEINAITEMWLTFDQPCEETGFLVAVDIVSKLSSKLSTEFVEN